MPVRIPPPAWSGMSGRYVSAWFSIGLRWIHRVISGQKSGLMPASCVLLFGATLRLGVLTSLSLMAPTVRQASIPVFPGKLTLRPLFIIHFEFDEVRTLVIFHRVQQGLIIDGSCWLWREVPPHRCLTTATEFFDLGSDLAATSENFREIAFDLRVGVIRIIHGLAQ